MSYHNFGSIDQRLNSIEKYIENQKEKKFNNLIKLAWSLIILTNIFTVSAVIAAIIHALK
jgi:hypothetical protein